jgi:hypothetical protein
MSRPIVHTDRVWVPTRLQIAQHWQANPAHLAASAASIG